MAGPEVAARLRALPVMDRVPLDALRGYSREDLARRFPDSLAFDHHLVKPSDPDKLRDLLAVLGG
jgi:two-component system CheB/CheR fusion protein